MLNDYKLQIDCLTKKINQIQYEHEIHNRDNAKELKDAQIHIKKLLTEKLKYFIYFDMFQMIII
jgi:hypothetical protein